MAITTTKNMTITRCIAQDGKLFVMFPNKTGHVFHALPATVDLSNGFNREDIVALLLKNYTPAQINNKTFSVTVTVDLAP